MKLKESLNEIKSDLRYLFKFLRMEASGCIMAWIFHLCNKLAPESVANNMILVIANDWLPAVVIVLMTLFGAWEIFADATISAIRKGKRLRSVIKEKDDNGLFMGNSDELPDDKAKATEKVEDMFTGINVDDRSSVGGESS